MGYNRENYRRVREAYATKYMKAEAEADRRAAQLHKISPALAEIDRELAKTGAAIALAAIGTGEDHREKLAAVREKNLALQAKRAELLAALGYPADYTNPPYECEKCRDTGFVGTKMCDCMRQALILAAYEDSGLGALLRRQSFENFDLSYYRGEAAGVMQKNVEFLRAYARDFAPETADNLLFFGGTGLGKTHLSSALARELIARGFDVYYTTAADLFATFEAVRFEKNGDGADKSDVERFTTCEFLILDDLGAEMTNQFTLSCLYTVLNERLNRHLPFLVSTNLPPKAAAGAKRADDLISRYGDRIISRLLGECRALRFQGEDVRIQKLSR